MLLLVGSLMNTGTARISLTGVALLRWLLIVVAGVAFLAVSMFGRVNDHPAQAEQVQSTLVSFPTESVMREVPSTTASELSTATPVPTVVTTSLPSTPVPVTETPMLPLLTVVDDARVNVRIGPGTDYTRIGALETGAVAAILGRYGDWWQIAYEDGMGWVASWLVIATHTGDVPEVDLPLSPSTDSVPSPTPILPPAPSADIDEDRWIDVDLSRQLLTAYERHSPVRTMLVSTGLPSTPTPTGQFRIWVKFRYDDMEGPGYYLEDVPFVMYFHKGYGLHGATWHTNFGHPMSHGCVNLPVEEAEWLFNWADVGTLVNVHDQQSYGGSKIAGLPFPCPWCL
jgi:hypothetical protein